MPDSSRRNSFALSWDCRCGVGAAMVPALVRRPKKARRPARRSGRIIPNFYGYVLLGVAAAADFARSSLNLFTSSVMPRANSSNRSTGMMTRPTTIGWVPCAPAQPRSTNRSSRTQPASTLAPLQPSANMLGTGSCRGMRTSLPAAAAPLVSVAGLLLTVSAIDPVSSGGVFYSYKACFRDGAPQVYGAILPSRDSKSLSFAHARSRPVLQQHTPLNQEFLSTSANDFLLKEKYLWRSKCFGNVTNSGGLNINGKKFLRAGTLKTG